MGRILAEEMRRYWVSKEQIQDDRSRVTFSGDLFHHIFDVCRQGFGSKFEVLTGDHSAYLVEVSQIGRRTAEAKIIETRSIPPLKKPYIHLALSIPRFQVMDNVVEKAVEMGVKSIRPFFSENSFVRSSSSLPDGKIKRWEKIIVSATQQSGRGDLMDLQPALPLDELLSQFNQDKSRMGLLAYEGVGQKSLQQYIQASALKYPDEIWLFIGSEGGFSSTEVQRFEGIGLPPVTLGEQVLRVETACIALVSVLKYEFQLMR